MIPCNFKKGGANVALEKKVVAQKDALLAQTDLSRIGMENKPLLLHGSYKSPVNQTNTKTYRTEDNYII